MSPVPVVASAKGSPDYQPVVLDFVQSNNPESYRMLVEGTPVHLHQKGHSHFGPFRCIAVEAALCSCSLAVVAPLHLKAFALCLGSHRQNTAGGSSAACTSDHFRCKAAVVQSPMDLVLGGYLWVDIVVGIAEMVGSLTGLVFVHSRQHWAAVDMVELRVYFHSAGIAVGV
mmetsp:Transcript_1169/g.2446  ORF Transcript_1169/g.2446 Transcript_1169/m.2446 type:complete len:171 (-) Transcript_1169:3109-3621(-)